VWQVAVRTGHLSDRVGLGVRLGEQAELCENFGQSARESWSGAVECLRSSGARLALDQCSYPRQPARRSGARPAQARSHL
jgi:hypothetical protein